MRELERCTLCLEKEDPRWGLLSKEGIFYPLCDGCAPEPGDVKDTLRVAEACRASDALGHALYVPRFGVNE